MNERCSIFMGIKMGIRFVINGISMGISLMEYISINDGLYNGNIMGIQWNMFMRYN
jgi:hypothetical protein